ncbi:Bax inhibitor-1/YccA family protein [Paenibacillus sp. MER 180]|uniref:Bax inhibitor-1/YccA family protein n=1 Tax=Paenibacillus sp. MER 180 TaxID=2939570 RepID=UPI00203BBD0E|nr:Bax inhibitor-1/YccA family protein [Paenibacillus sp. MER 180]MCM3288874.1 Bax inhibitor-1/YccA family protein [Paenibacillus sp. MER 180]
MIGRSGNPTLNEETFANQGNYENQERMTIGGTVNKSFMALALLVGAAVISWTMFANGYNMNPYLIGGVIGGAILALIISFVPTTAPFLTPIYAIAKGLFLGAISARFEAWQGGITLQAVLLTMCVFMGMLLVYRLGLIKATDGFRKGVITATAGVALVYLFSFILGFFGITIPYLHESSLIGIGISVVIIIIAALNFILDFNLIEEGAEHGAPKHMEWYGAFGLLVTLVWLYIEIIRLLAKIANRD